MKRLYLSLFFLCLCTLSVLAQKYSLTGVVHDALDGESLPGAAVTLLQQKDSAQVAGVTTDANGKFTLNTGKTGNYILRLTYMGYVTIYKNVTIQKSTKEQNLGQFTMQQDAKTIKEVTVNSQLAQVEVKEDTFVYNADAYRLPEGSTLEELVRKLPGAEIGEDGTLKINGKTVSKILVKGKEFFGGDKDMAMKNLPTKMINKIKAYEKKSDYSRITGIDDGEEETVIDLTVKRGMGEGWMVNVDVAAGDARQDDIPGINNPIKFPKPLYTGNFNVSRFTDNLQFMFIASRNNINNGSGRWGGFGGGSGVTTTTMVGLNVTWTNGLPQFTPGYMEMGGNVRWNGRDAEGMTVNNSETFLSTISSSYSNAYNWSHNKSNNINADMRFQWMPDSLLTLTFRPSFSHSENNNRGNNRSVTFNEDPYNKMTDPLNQFKDDNLFADNDTRVNSNESESHSSGNGNSGNMNMQVNRRLGKAGRNLSLDMNGSYSKNDNKSYNWSDINYYQKGTRTLQDRYTYSPSESWHIQSRLSYTEPLTKNLNLQMSYQYQRRFNDNNRSMYNLENLMDQIEGGVDEAMLYDIFTNGVNDINAYIGNVDWQQYTLDALNSQYATYKENNHNGQVMFRYNNKTEDGQEFRLNAGMSFQPQHTLMHYAKGVVDTTVTRTTVNWAPRMDFRWKINKTDQFRVNYNARMNQPSMTQLMEVTDDSNPLNVNTGNAGLRSSWANNMYVQYNGYLQETQTSWNLQAGYNNTKNSISSATIYDSNTGARYTRPMNISGNWGSWGNANFNTAMGPKKYWNFSNNLNYNYNYRLGYLSTNGKGITLDPEYIYTDGRVDMDKIFSQVDLSQFKSATKTLGLGDNIRLNYRQNFGDNWSLDFGATSGFWYNHTQSTAQTGNNIDSWSFNYGGNCTIMFPWNVTFTSNITEQSRRGYADANMNTNELIWNATLQKSFLKNKAATISVEWNDILHQRSNVSRAISEFSRTDTYTNNINSYFMCHFIYKLNLMGNKDARGSMPAGMGGPGGPGGQGGRGGFGGPGGGGGRGGYGGGRF